ncbi:MAG: NDP-sugar synthase, partial [Candidatus Bathyarchaeota archaeon]
RLAIERFVNRNVFFAVNGDQIADLKLRDLADFHVKNAPVATIATANPRCPYGQVHVNDNYEIVEFMEKPLCQHTRCNAGIYVFNREILDYLPERGDVEKVTFPALAKLGKLSAYPFNGFFVTVNTPKDLVEVEMELRRNLSCVSS